MNILSHCFFSVFTAILCLKLFLPLATVAWIFDEKNAKAILDIHNDVRNRLPGLDKDGNEFYNYAANMRLVQWDRDLAKQASTYAEKCLIIHGRVKDSDYWKVRFDKRNYEQGQNIWVVSTLSWENFAKAGSDWYNSETKYFSWTTFTCLDGEVCGHLTQMMWHDSEFLGCGWARCINRDNDLNPSNKNKTFTNVVCHYSNAGNYVGQTPFEISHKSASNCPPGYERDCEYSNLCSMKSCVMKPSTPCPEDGKGLQSNTCFKYALKKDYCKLSGDGSDNDFYIGFTKCSNLCGLCVNPQPPTVENDPAVSNCVQLYRNGYCSKADYKYLFCPRKCGTKEEILNEYNTNKDRLTQEFGINISESTQLFYPVEIYPGNYSGVNQVACSTRCLVPSSTTQEPVESSRTSGNTSWEQVPDIAEQLSKEKINGAGQIKGQVMLGLFLLLIGLLSTNFWHDSA